MKYDDITVSYVVTVYNKEVYIEQTIRSLLQQTGGIASEYIFVDDVSTDRSLEVIEQLTAGIHHVVIIRNSENKGPSVRLNQGARAARGKYLQFIDSDDILAANATEMMLALLQRHEADVVYGTWEKTGLPGEALLQRMIPANATHEVSDAPLEFVLDGRFIRMTQMVVREVFLRAGGCDERVFIQDESLPLRLSYAAKRFVALHAPVMFVPQVEGELSGNKSQLNHDRFLAHYYMLQDFRNLSARASSRLYRRCLSAAWKQLRQSHDVRAYTSSVFLRYLFSRLGKPAVNEDYLARLKRYFDELPGVRRVR